MGPAVIAAGLSVPTVSAAIGCLKRGEGIEGAFFALASSVLFGFAALGATA